MKPPILFLEQQSWRAGAQRVLECVLEALKEDFAPIVVFPDDGPLAQELRERGFETLTFPLGRYQPGAKSPGEKLDFAARSLCCAVDLARMIFQKGARLVYINGPRCLPAGAMAARLMGKPSLFHLHRTLTRKSELWVATRFAALATRIVSCSQASAEALLAEDKNLAVRTQVVYNPAKLLTEGDRKRRESLPPSPDFPLSAGPVVGMVGRLAFGKGAHVLVEAAAQLRARWPEIQIVIVGAPEAGNSQDASYLRRLESRIAELDLGRNIRWTGFASDLGRHYARFDVLALPSVDDGDGVPMVALEAAEWGLPVVASRAGGIPEVVREGVNGLLVPPDDARSLAETLARVLADPQLRLKLSSNARLGLDDRFSPEVFRRAIHGIVCGLASRPPGRAGTAHGREADAKT